MTNPQTPRPHTAIVALESGATVRIPARDVVRFAGLSAEGWLVYREGDLLYYVTDCCHASGKGSFNSPTLVCCRGCYRDVPTEFGSEATVTDPALTPAGAPICPCA